MKNIFLKFGLIYGAFSIISVMMYYHGFIGMGLNPVVGILLLILLLWLAGREFKSINEGYATFGELFKLYFLIIFIGLFMSMLFTLIYHSVISEETKTEIFERYVESQKAMYRWMISDEDMLLSIEEGIDDEMSPEKLFGFQNTLLGMFGSLFYVIIFALLAAVIFKKVPKQDPL